MFTSCKAFYYSNYIDTVQVAAGSKTVLVIGPGQTHSCA